MWAAGLCTEELLEEEELASGPVSDLGSWAVREGQSQCKNPIKGPCVKTRVKAVHGGRVAGNP